MNRIWVSSSALALLMAALLTWAPWGSVAAQDQGPTRIDMEPGQVMLEFVGQIVDLPTDLPRSNQFGYLSFIKGVELIFISPPFNETTAMFRFFAQATTTQEITNGPFRKCFHCRFQKRPARQARIGNTAQGSLLPIVLRSLTRESGCDKNVIPPGSIA